MSSPLHSLPRAALVALSDALAGGRLGPPFGAATLQRYAAGPDIPGVAAELQNLNSGGMLPSHIAYVLRAIAAERESAQRSSDRIELVWTGPEHTGASSRDTGVVVRELFSSARESIDVVGFAVFNGRSVFQQLGANMAGNPALAVRMFLNIGRGPSDSRPESDIVSDFVLKFISRDWPEAAPLPLLYHDPRALKSEGSKRASLHAKCVIVDRRWSFITSANFTEAAQERNIEAGVLVEDIHLARALRAQLDALVSSGLLKTIEK